MINPNPVDFPPTLSFHHPFRTLRAWLKDGGAKGIEGIQLAESQIGDGYGFLSRELWAWRCSGA